MLLKAISDVYAVGLSMLFNPFFQEMETQGNSNPCLGKSLQHYETHVIAEFLQRHKLEGLLLNALVAKDPLEVSI